MRGLFQLLVLEIMVMSSCSTSRLIPLTQENLDNQIDKGAKVSLIHNENKRTKWKFLKAADTFIIVIEKTMNSKSHIQI